MDKVTNQSMPIWDRPSRERGHKSSVDKAVAAHRTRVAARIARTESRLATAREVNSQFFPKPQFNKPQIQESSMPNFAPEIESAQISQMPIEETFKNDLDINLGDGSLGPDQVEDLYSHLSVEPIRSHAKDIVEKDSQEAQQEFQSDEVPKGSYVDYTI